MALELRRILEGVRDVPDGVLGKELREALMWEVGKGMNVGKPVSYYLLRIKRRWDACKEQRVHSGPRRAGSQGTMSALVQAAMEAQG